MPRRRIFGISVALAACTVSASVTLAQPSPLGPEFQVNTYTTGAQIEAAVAMDAAGSFVVVWGSVGQDGNSYGLFGRRFTSSGSAIGGELQVNTFTNSIQRSHDVAPRTNGDFVAVWQSGLQDGDVFGVFGQLFSAAGAKQGVEFRVNTVTAGQQANPSVASDATGNFVVTWQSALQDGDSYGIFAQRFDNSGSPQGGEFPVNTQTAGTQLFPAAAMDANGDFVIVWNDENVGDVSGKRFDSGGAVVGAEFRVNFHTDGNQGQPSVATEAGGGFVVVWQSQDGSDNGIFGRRFNSSGAALGGDFPVNVYTPGSQSPPQISRTTNGDFVVTWIDPALDGSSFGVFGLAFNKFAGPQGEDQFQINSYTPGAQSGVDVAMGAGGDFVVAWLSVQDGDSAGIFARRFASPLRQTIDVDGNGSAEPLSDGILMLRYLFGFRGGSLITGAVAGDCSRCEAPAIEAFIAPLVP